MAKIIQDTSQIPVVISVSSNLKIEDQASREFSENFYHNLLIGNTIGKSFNNAIETIGLDQKQKAKRFTCCCAHSHFGCPHDNHFLD
jgi:hypothetical protein